MDCDYCNTPKTNDYMSRETAFKVADMALATALQQNHKTACISFYGGEPLLCKEFIYDTIDYCRHISRGENVRFTYRITTNGTLVDSDFIGRCKAEGIKLALSIDGIQEAHDKHRRFQNGSATFSEVQYVGKTILRELPETTAMLTLNEDTTPMLYDSVNFLYDFGFKKVVISLNYSGRWSETSLAALNIQYEHLATWYGNKLLNNEDFSLPLFDSKFINLLTPQLDEERCVPGKLRISISTDGSIYPCTQYVGHSEYLLGNANIDSEPDKTKLASLSTEHVKELPSCEGCAISKRCDHTCGCKNIASTGFARMISPMICTHEQMLVSITDRLGERIFMPAA